MTEAELINGIQRAAQSGEFEIVYSPDDLRDLLVDHLRETGYFMAAEKLQAAMQSLQQPECDCEE